MWMAKKNKTAITLQDISNYCHEREFKCKIIFNREASKLMLIAIHDYFFYPELIMTLYSVAKSFVHSPELLDELVAAVNKFFGKGFLVFVITVSDQYVYFYLPFADFDFLVKGRGFLGNFKCHC